MITTTRTYFVSTDITINGTLLPVLSKGGCTVTEHKLWSGNTGRSSVTGLSTGDIVSIKYELALTWDTLYDDDLELIDSLVNTMTSYFPVTWCRTKSEGYRTDNMFANDPSFTKETCVKGRTKYTGYSVTLVMQ